MIYRYQRAVIEGPTGTVYTHAAGDGALTELATLDDGYTYVALAPGSELPEQPDTIVLEPVVLDSATRDAIAAASAVLDLVNQDVVRKIRERYTPDDEIKLLRIAPSAETQAWNDYVEGCRAWGRERKAALGL